jgi:hypothetical protein
LLNVPPSSFHKQTMDIRSFTWCRTGTASERDTALHKSWFITFYIYCIHIIRTKASFVTIVWHASWRYLQWKSGSTHFT